MGYRSLKGFWKIVSIVAIVTIVTIGNIRAQGSGRQDAGAPLPLSVTAKASIITCGPGDDFYTTFGHSALRIQDTAKGIDLVYNYGTFDFDTPHFYWKFMRGRLDYMLGRSSFEEFMAEYRYYGRAVWEQTLNFTPQEVCNLFLLMEQNYLPEYRYYRYDFFRDNCATRPRDMVYLACGKQDVESGKRKVKSGMSYRDYLHSAMRGKLEWWALGVDLLLGLPADHKCTADEAMFYPLVMEQEFAEFRRNGSPLVGPTVTLLEENRAEVPDSFPPFVVFTLVFAAVAVLGIKGQKGQKWQKSFAVVSRVLFVLAGLIGLFLLFMWFGTNHYCTEWNLNILWLSPLLLLIAIRMERSPKWALWLQLAMFAAAVVWVVWCHLSIAFIPLIFTLALCTGALLKVKS